MGPEHAFAWGRTRRSTCLLVYWLNIELYEASGITGNLGSPLSQPEDTKRRFNSIQARDARHQYIC